VVRSASLWPVLVLWSLLAACRSPGAQEAPATPTLVLRPHRSATPAPTPLAPQPSLPAPTPQATPTPLTHVVRSGETLLEIAAAYGVSLDALLALNPMVEPRFLSVGQELLIPGPEGEVVASLLPTPTALPVELTPVRCYPTPTGGLWCITTAVNRHPFALEGLSAQISLLDARGRPLAVEAAYAPLNVLPEGDRFPLAVHFARRPQGVAVAAAALTSAVPARSEAEARLAVAAEVTQVEPRPGGRTWRVEGALRVTGGDEGQVVLVRLLLVALDGLEEAVGFRVWEGELTLGVDPPAAFDLEVYSLGPEVAAVRAVAEILSPGE
jgi:LysM repeat protein